MFLGSKDGNVCDFYDLIYFVSINSIYNFSSNDWSEYCTKLFSLSSPFAEEGPDSAAASVSFRMWVYFKFMHSVLHSGCVHLHTRMYI